MRLRSALRIVPIPACAMTRTASFVRSGARGGLKVADPLKRDWLIACRPDLSE